MSRPDYYALLGVPRTADAAAIRSAFHELAMVHHPDRSGPGGTGSFQRIVEAYEVLSDPRRRAAYDLGCRCAAPATPVRRRWDEPPLEPLDPGGAGPAPLGSAMSAPRRRGEPPLEPLDPRSATGLGTRDGVILLEVPGGIRILLRVRVR